MPHRLTIRRKLGASKPEDQEQSLDLDECREILVAIDLGGGAVSTYRICVDGGTLLVKSDDGSKLRTGQDYVRFYPDQKE